MSKLIYINYRNNPPSNISKKLFKISKLIEPENIEANPPFIYTENKTFYSIVNPVENVKTEDGCILLGYCKSIDNWYKVHENISDGSYAIIRENEKTTELLSDNVGSRTLWYYFDENIFVTSTSQKAIVLYLENFEFNEKLIPWMLSTGTLGPEFSWDKRIKRLKPKGRVLLNKANWNLTEEYIATKFIESNKSFKYHKSQLFETIKSTFSSLNINYENWVLPLSGGYDSRAILYLLKDSINNTKSIKTITWGTKNAVLSEGNDASVAEKVSKIVGTNHNYFPIDSSIYSPELILKRFLDNGEGRVDHISGYTDGFFVWKSLFENGVNGIIRGDEGFGWVDVASPLRVRYNIGCAHCEDFINLKNYRQYGIPEQVIPTYMLQGKDESLETWRDRLYHEFRIPTVLSALSDLKLGYVEQITPLMSDNIITAVQNLPDKLRTDKFLFRKITENLKPKLKYATKSATSDPQNILSSTEVMSYIRKELSSSYAKEIFSEEFLHMIIEKSQINKDNTPKNKYKKWLKPTLIKLIPNKIRIHLASNHKLSLDNNILMFRVYIIIYMHQKLSFTESFNE
ncbi:hypothetical protein [Zobellia sp. B3R18]|uniref:hypothetical protein n=1 Tax=Zobellia sp. B3R18 TaxID=2841568 RepID=UPI001C06AD87|nr:hypothetical protein [Zobellia sp. B3R18]MBU2975928.1 hypothetical protein [Zobellia sp. B3R18]